MLRVVLAFMVAPFPAAFIQSLVVAFWPKEGMGVFEHPASMFVAICILFYIFEIIVGIPAFLILRKRQLRGFLAYAAAGLITVLAPVIIALGWAATHGRITIYVAAYNVVFFAFGGILAGALFWIISRPDQGTGASRNVALHPANEQP